MAVINKLKLMEIANRIALFKALSAHERDMIISMPGIVQVISQFTEFIRYGEYSENLYIILSGKASVYRDDKQIAQIGGGDFVGEVGFICHEARTASVVANEQLITLRISSSNFSRLPANLREKIKDRLIGGLVARVHRLNDEVIDLTDGLDILASQEQEQALEAQTEPTEAVTNHEQLSDGKTQASSDDIGQKKQGKNKVEVSTWQKHIATKNKS